MSHPMYDPRAVQPMRDELVRVGFQELLTSDEVDQVLGKRDGSALLVVNSVCGCAAAGARPGVMLALQHGVIPDELTTVFAGMERGAVETARSYLEGYPPSSPSIALFRDGEVVFMLERRDIEGRHPADIAEVLRREFDRHCGRKGPSISAEDFAKLTTSTGCGSQVPRFEG